MAYLSAILFFSALALVKSEEDHHDLYVSVEGDDSWGGNLPSPAHGAGPFATLLKACETARVIKDRPVVINVEEGSFYLNQTLTFEEEDSRSVNTSLVFRPFSTSPGRPPTPTVSAGFILTEWKTLSNGLIEITVPDEVTIDVTQLFVNGQRQPVARKPNTGYLYWKSPLRPCKNSTDLNGDINWRDVSARPACSDVNKLGFVFKEGDINKNWTNTDRIRLLVFHAWTATWSNIRSVNFENNTVLFTEAINTPIGEFDQPSGHRYVVENVLEELDSPGEWYFDSQKRTILYWPPKGLEKPEFIVPNLRTLISLNNVENIFFKGLSFQFSAEGSDNRLAYYTDSAAVQVTNSKHIVIDSCEFTHTGANGITITGNSSDVVINSCRVADNGAEGIYLQSDVEDIVVNNTIVDTTGFIYMQQPSGIRVQGRRNVSVTHNEVLNVPYAGIMIGWQAGFPWTPSSAEDHYIFRAEYNHVHHYGLGILSDFGGIYVSALVSCWHPPQPTAQVRGDELLTTSDKVSCNMATLVKQNLIHDGVCYNYGADGVYDDEAGAGLDVVENIIYDVDASGVYFHCGVNLTATNNFVINSDRIGKRAALSACNMGGFPIRVPVEFEFMNNILYVTGEKSHLMAASDFIDKSTFDKNVYYNTSQPLKFFGGVDFEHWQHEGKDIHSVVADPKFFSVTNRDFHLQPDSPALKQGIKQISTSPIGPQDNPFGVLHPKLWSPLKTLAANRFN